MRNDAEAEIWLRQAEDHLEAAIDLSRRRKEPLPKHVCYCCRLAAEYYLKAFLLFNKESVFKSNDLLILLESSLQYAPPFEVQKELFALLNPYTEAILHPGKSIGLEEAHQALKVIKRIREIFIERFPPNLFETLRRK